MTNRWIGEIDGMEFHFELLDTHQVRVSLWSPNDEEYSGTLEGHIDDVSLMVERLKKKRPASVKLDKARDQKDKADATEHK